MCKRVCWIYACACVCVRVCVSRAAAPSMSIKMLIIHLSYHIQYKSYQFWNEPYNLQICITHAYSRRSRARARESAKEIERVVYGRERASVREKHRKKRRERPRAREGKTCLTRTRRKDMSYTHARTRRKDMSYTQDMSYTCKLHCAISPFRTLDTLRQFLHRILTLNWILLLHRQGAWPHGSPMHHSLCLVLCAQVEVRLQLCVATRRVRRWNRRVQEDGEWECYMAQNWQRLQRIYICMYIDICIYICVCICICMLLHGARLAAPATYIYIYVCI